MNQGEAVEYGSGHVLHCADCLTHDYGQQADTITFDPPFDKRDFYRHIPAPTETRDKLIVFCDSLTLGKAMAGALDKGWQFCFQAIFVMDATHPMMNRPMQSHKGAVIFTRTGKLQWSFEKSAIFDGIHRRAQKVKGRFGDYMLGARDSKTFTTIEYVKIIRDKDKNHPHQKPWQWLRCLLGGLQSELVYDMFAGSGIVSMACEKIGARCISVELDEKQCDKIIDYFHNGKPIMEMVKSEAQLQSLFDDVDD